MLYFSYNCIEASVRAYGRCPMCNEPTSADSLIPNVTCKLGYQVTADIYLIDSCFLSSGRSHLQI